jgi:hypothetical protein
MAGIKWTYESAPQVKTGQYVGRASHGQYWRGHEGDPDGATWFAVYKPTGGVPELLIDKASAKKMYDRCTEHDQSGHGGDAEAAVDAPGGAQGWPASRARHGSLRRRQLRHSGGR